MSSCIKVSVIVLTYNHEKYICQTLDSILMQKTNFCYEVLIGDDASLDGTQRILQKYKSAYPHIFKLFLRSTNIGATRNGYELNIHARGQYIATLDGDDFWTDDRKLQIQSNFLDVNDKYIACCHKYDIVDETGALMKFPPYIDWVSNKKVFQLSDFKGGILPGHPSTIMKRNIFINPKYDYSILYKAHKMISDRTSAMITLALGDYYMIDRKMGVYRFRLKIGGDNLTSQLYVTDNNAILNDYIFTCRLQGYAENVLGIDGGFEQRKKELLVSAIYQALKNKDKTQMEVAFKILQEAKSKFSYICFSFFIILKKATIKCYRKLCLFISCRIK